MLILDIFYSNIKKSIWMNIALNKFSRILDFSKKESKSIKYLRIFLILFLWFISFYWFLFINLLNHLIFFYFYWILDEFVEIYCLELYFIILFFIAFYHFVWSLSVICDYLFNRLFRLLSGPSLFIFFSLFLLLYHRFF